MIPKLVFFVAFLVVPMAHAQLISHLLAPLAYYINKVPKIQFPTPTTAGSELKPTTESLLQSILSNEIHEPTKEPQIPMERILNLQENDRFPVKVDKLLNWDRSNRKPDDSVVIANPNSDSQVENTKPFSPRPSISQNFQPFPNQNQRQIPVQLRPLESKFHQQMPVQRIPQSNVGNQQIPPSTFGDRGAFPTNFNQRFEPPSQSFQPNVGNQPTQFSNGANQAAQQLAFASQNGRILPPGTEVRGFPGQFPPSMPRNGQFPPSVLRNGQQPQGNFQSGQLPQRNFQNTLNPDSIAPKVQNPVQFSSPAPVIAAETSPISVAPSAAPTTHASAEIVNTVNPKNDFLKNARRVQFFDENRLQSGGSRPELIARPQPPFQ